MEEKYYLCYGLNQLVRGVFTKEMIQEIWERSSGFHADPNFIWNQREATQEDIEKYKVLEIEIKR